MSKEITPERYYELVAAWVAADEIERLILPKASFHSCGGDTYLEHPPNTGELKAYARIKALEAELRTVKVELADVKALLDLARDAAGVISRPSILMIRRTGE